MCPLTFICPLYMLLVATLDHARSPSCISLLHEAARSCLVQRCLTPPGTDKPSARVAGAEAVRPSTAQQPHHPTGSQAGGTPERLSRGSVRFSSGDLPILDMSPAETLETMTDPESRGNARVMESCCKVLRVYCRDNEDHCETVSQAGGVAALASAMRAHPGIAALQQQACAVLIHLCAGESPRRRDATVWGGGLDAVIVAMKEHRTLQGIQEMAFVAIRNVCLGEDAGAKERKDRAVNLGALEAIVNALMRHTGNSFAQQGAATLQLLTHNHKQHRARATASGARAEWLRTPGQSTGPISVWATSRLPGLSTKRRMSREGELTRQQLSG